MSPSRPTIHDVALRSGVSKSLVSLALSGSPKVSVASRERVLRAVEELGYRPNAAARSLAVRRSQTVGVLILDLHNPVFAEILDGVQTELRQHGFSTMLVTGGGSPEEELAEINKLLEFQIEGLVLIAHGLSSGDLRGISEEVPTVTVTREDISAPLLDTVCNDDVAGTALAVDHLVSLGHRRIAFLSGGDHPVSHLRVTGYREAMERHGLSENVLVVAGGLTDLRGYQAAKEALGHEVTALCVANDIAAIGAIAAIEEVGLTVPGEISVVGYDGISIGGLKSVNLTTVAQPLSTLGQLAARRILQRIDQPKSAATHQRVGAELVIRGTTGPALR
jgi:DNA-binding LacI/PurR family transcriptional regulator